VTTGASKVHAASTGAVTTGEVFRTARAEAVSAAVSTAGRAPASPPVAAFAAVGPNIETISPDDAATTAVRRPTVPIWSEAAEASSVSGVDGRRAARWRARVVLTVTRCLS
jgi:hypothetical protein